MNPWLLFVFTRKVPGTRPVTVYLPVLSVVAEPTEAPLALGFTTAIDTPAIPAVPSVTVPFNVPPRLSARFTFGVVSPVVTEIAVPLVVTHEPQTMSVGVPFNRLTYP